ncbi:MAG: CHASE2 domain-containing protein, partial [Gammaproteobacteria bacterium]|nr:CHASE2 domain-containing protein [Gammaproteobacteria bacterium]
MPHTILLISANPEDTARLQLNKEAREIAEGLRLSPQRDTFCLEKSEAARIKDVRRAMLNHHPRIVHFCGHGEGNAGIVFEDESGHARLVNTEGLAGLFALFADKMECVVLNACYSEIQAEAIARHIPYVVGMSQTIGDNAAQEFSVAFYDAIGAGKSFDFAYKMACNAIQLAGIPEHLTPVLKKRDGIPVQRKKAPPITKPETPQVIENTPHPSIEKHIEPPLPPAVRPIRIWRRSPLPRAVLLLIAVLSIVYYLPYSPVRALEEYALDVLIAITQHHISDSSSQFVFFDIDDDTYRKSWKKPLLTPRRHIKTLLDIAVEAQAAVVILDIDLSLAGEDGEVLRQTLQDHSASAQCPDRRNQAGKLCTQILLVRFFEFAGEYWEPIPSFLDEVVEESPNLHWVSASLNTPAFVRAWQPWQSACVEGKTELTPGAVWMAAALLAEPEIGAVGSIYQALKGFEGGACGTALTQGLLPWQYPQEHTRPLHLELPASSRQQRILYKIDGEYHGHSLLRVWSAADLRPDSAESEYLKAAGQAVLIGGSFPAAGDTKVTPLGNMPGAVVLLNALYSFQQFGQLVSVPFLVCILLCGGAAAGLYFINCRRGIMWTLALGTATGIAWFSVSFHLLSYGIWLDFSFAWLVWGMFAVSALYGTPMISVKSQNGPLSQPVSWQGVLSVITAAIFTVLISALY